MENRCVCCGEIIPEGRMVCPQCENSPAAVDAAKLETKTALQTIYDALKPGQQKHIVKDEKGKALFDLYGVEYSE